MKCLALGLAALLGTTALTHAGNEEFIPADTRIEGCIAIVNEVRDGTITPTEWLEQNKEEFRDLALELKKRKYPEAKAKGMLMGMAITFCMERKSYTNICVTAPDPSEKRDLQIMRTAHIAECWARLRAEPTPREPPVPPIIEPVYRPCPPVHCPENYMTPAQRSYFQEDLAILSGPIAVYQGGGNAYERLASCRDHWASMVDSTPDRNAGWVRWSVRVRRCMYRTGFVNRCPGMQLVQQNGWEQAVAEAQRVDCYARW
jgi:hypothetical protein